MKMAGTSATAVPFRRGTSHRALVFMVAGATLLVFAYRAPLLLLFLAGILAALTVILLRRDGRSGAALGLDLSLRRLAQCGAGAVGGALLAVIVLGLARLVTPFHWVTNATFKPAMAGFALAFLVVANACEELVFRGYAFDVLLRVLGAWPAQALVAVAFALFHVACGWPWLDALTATTAGSLLFGLVMIRWHSLPAAIGLHVMWNWTRGLLFQSPATPGTLWVPLGVERWGTAERASVQILLVAVTLLACAVLAAGTRRPRSSWAAWRKTRMS